MRAFYDKIVPSVLKDVLRKVGGGQVEAVQIDSSETLGDVGEGSLAVVRANGELIALTDYDSQAYQIANEHSGSRVIPANEVRRRGTQQPGFTITPRCVSRLRAGCRCSARSRRRRCREHAPDLGRARADAPSTTCCTRCRTSRST